MLPESLFISEQVQEREVELADGAKHKLHFKQLPASEFRKFFFASQSKDDQKQAEAMARLISASLCTPDGKVAISMKDALRLTPGAEKAISEAVLDVNGMGKPGND